MSEDADCGNDEGHSEDHEAQTIDHCRYHLPLTTYPTVFSVFVTTHPTVFSSILQLVPHFLYSMITQKLAILWKIDKHGDDITTFDITDACV